MPLSDLFRKSPKKETAKAPQPGASASSATSDSLLSPEMQKKRYEAATEFVKVFQEKVPLVSGKPHAGTILAVAARLAGSSLYRSLNYNKSITPGIVVLSNEVNEAWPQLMNLFAFYCKQNGIDVMSKPLMTKFSEQDQPRMDVEQVLAEYQDQYHEIMQRYELDYLNSARTGMVVCSMVFLYHCTVARDIDPHAAAGIVAMGIVEGAKTAPPLLGSSKDKAPQEKAKNKDRLVLGEHDIAVQEALDHGGIFIDLNPEIARTLQAGNIDPYIIYEKAMLNQIEAKIPRIDFVKADVDQLFDEWKSKSHPEIPVYVRLIMWLKNNARTHGYEQSGNSWILKR